MMFRSTFMTLNRVEHFILAGLITYGALSAIFWLYCQIGGHNFTEAIYAWTSIHVFSIGAGIIFAWLSFE